jgi:hypothetical protein
MQWTMFNRHECAADALYRRIGRAVAQRLRATERHGMT